MIAVRKILAVAMTGVVLGSGASVFTAAPATARIYNCDQQAFNMERQAAKDFKKGKLSAADYAKVQAEIAYHRTLWGC